LRRSTDYADWACVALYYSALQLVDSVLCDDPDLPKDERHPRKHSGVVAGSRGRNQLVKSQMPTVSGDYRKLEELSRRTRYDMNLLAGPDANAYDKAIEQWQRIQTYAAMMHMTRPPISTEYP
jgi:hypothetical protein